MSRLHDSQKADLVTATKCYVTSYQGSPAERYLAHRGLPIPAGPKYGFVSEPAVGHEQYRGRLAIPYWRPGGGIHAVATIRFRCIADRCVKSPDGSFVPPHQERHEGHGRYMGLPGHPPRLYNTPALLTSKPYIALNEGELDSDAVQGADVPAVGTPGVSTWRDHFDPALAGFEIVFVLGDGDQAGRQFAAKICERLPNAKAIDLGDGYDAARFIHEFGPERFRERLGL
ncbi:topoisomerase [Streptomyces sp. G1]|uniref:topoisomerase n=1 Tax=Streptomyces sp. G1 TaxID=361572 RepID=UPI00202E8A0E|nr:topoisomerase [Streptomyces sp. G1]MCM1967817.1 topoisomerase [Streptomyces sp. G1]